MSTAAPTSKQPAPRQQRAALPVDQGERLRPVRVRRRWWWAGLGAALIATGALANYWLYTVSNKTRPVLAVKETIHRGEVIDSGKLVASQISFDTGIDPIAVGDFSTVRGLVAVTDIPAGSLLTRAALSDQPIPGKGLSRIAIPLKPGRLPAGLAPGDKVRIVDVPSDVTAKDAAAPAIEAVVVSVNPDRDNTLIIVDVTVRADQAASAERRVGNGAVGLVLDNPAG